MLKLKYLFDNRSLAAMLLGYWKYDEDSQDLMNYFRISSNAIYPFRWNGMTRFLRFAPETEKDGGNLLAELEFLHYLEEKGFPALKPVMSEDSREMVTAATPWGEYYAAVFDRVPGKQIGDTDFSDSILFGYGKALGRLHKLSSRFEPENRRWSYEDVLDWIKNTLEGYDNQEAALEETELLRAFFAKLPKTDGAFGLVHYDFETDNVLYDEGTGAFGVIDFDDAMYHWYVMDIEQSLDSIRQEIEPSRYEAAKECFLEGYRSEYDVTDGMLSKRLAFRRFADLYGYTRILRSTAEKWRNEPEWLMGLREKLDHLMNTRSLNFGKAICVCSNVNNRG